MRTRLANLLRRWLALVDGPTQSAPPVPDAPFSFQPMAADASGVSLKARAVELTRAAEQAFPDTSGEYKRHQVYARLLKEFPTTKKSEVGYALERAVRDL